MNGVGLGRAERHQQHPPGGQQRPQPEGDALVRGVLAAEPLGVGGDRRGGQVEHPAGRVGRAARLVEPEVPVLAQPEDDGVDPAEGRELPLVLGDAGRGVFRPAAQPVEPVGRDAPGVGHLAPEQVGARPRVLDRDAEVLVEGEDVEVIDGRPPLGDEPVQLPRRVAAGDHQRAGVGQPAGQHVGGRPAGPLGTRVDGDVHHAPAGSATPRARARMYTALHPQQPPT